MESFCSNSRWTGACIILSKLNFWGRWRKPECQDQLVDTLVVVNKHSGMKRSLDQWYVCRPKKSNCSTIKISVCLKGCQYREHTVQILNDRDRAILKLAQVAAEGNCLYEPPPNKLLKANILNETWWNGIILTPSKDRPGLLPPIVLAGIINRTYTSVNKVVNYLFVCFFD